MFNARRLRECRLKKGLTQTELMFELDKRGLRVSRCTLLNWESGHTIPNANALNVLAGYFNKPIQYFFVHIHN